MRIKEEFKKLGYFWLPSAPRDRVPGTLSISDGGFIDLEIFGLFNDGLNSRREAFNAGLKRIIGHIENNEFVTLDDCSYKRTEGSGDISKSLIRVNTAFIGAKYDEGEIPCFDSLTFSIEGLDEWIRISGIEVDYQYEERAVTISYQQPATVSFNLGNGMQLSIIFSWRAPKYPIKEARIIQKTYFKLFSQKARKLDEFTSVAHQITTLLCFAMDQTVSLDSMSATSESRRENIGDGRTEPIPINIYYSSHPYSKGEPKIYPYPRLFGFIQIQNDVERIINNWIKAYEKINPTFDLYFSTQIGQSYLTVKFLTLVQGLEAYHHREKSLEAYRQRKKGDRELYLREKIEDVIKPFKGVIGNEEKRDKLIDEIVNTRNYLTHYNPEKESKAVKDEDLLPLCLKMELLFQLHFLQLIGFSREEIDSLLADSIPIRRRSQSL